MKKLILTLSAMGLATGAAFAQGYVAWSIPSGDVTFETNTAASPLFGGSGSGGTVGLTGTAAGGYDYALLYQSTPNGALSSDTAVWDGTWTGAAGNGGVNMTGVNGTGLPTHAGWVTPATVNGQSGTGVQVAWANGVTNSVVLVGWSADLGSTWVGVSNILAQLALGNNTPLLTQLAGQNGFFGETTIGNVNPAAGAPGNNIFAPSNAGLSTGDPIFSVNTPMYLLPVPEPATLALAGLGGLSLLLFRRQRK